MNVKHFLRSMDVYSHQNHIRSYCTAFVTTSWICGSVVCVSTMLVRQEREHQAPLGSHLILIRTDQPPIAPAVSLDGILVVGAYTRHALAHRCGGRGARIGSRGARVGIREARNRRTGERVLDRRVVDLCINQ
jgi:hypothetical protein